MTIKVVNTIPAVRKPHHNLRMFFKEFLASNIQYAELIFSDLDYSSPESAYNNIHRAAKKYHPLSVRVYKRGDKIYLERLV